MHRSVRGGVCLSITAAACLWAGQARANGGGYSFGVRFTGGVAPFQATGTEHVRIEEEQLDIALRRTSAAVVVRYTMRNQTPAPVRVRFGFPVEATRVSGMECGDDPDRRESSARGLSDCRRDDLRKSIDLLHGYTVTADGSPVKAEYQIEPFAARKVRPFKGSEVLKGIAGWMVSEVTFPAEQALVLEIRYSADFLIDEEGISDDTWRRVAFRYRLSTGAVWNGPIEKGTITVRADGIAADEVQVLKGNLARDGERWIRELSRLEPSLADDLEIRPMPGYFVPGDYRDEGEPRTYQHFLERGGERRKEGGVWGGAHQRFTASASSTLAPTKTHGFDPRRLTTPPRYHYDHDELGVAYPWCEGAEGNGVGEWIELTPAKPRKLLGLAIYPGYQQPRYYAWNGRPSRVEIILNDEHRFVATLGEIDPRDAGYALSGGQLVPIRGYDQPVKKLRITILEVAPGTRWEDTCIQRVLLYDLLPKAPEIRGAR